MKPVDELNEDLVAILRHYAHATAPSKLETAEAFDRLDRCLERTGPAGMRAGSGRRTRRLGIVKVLAAAAVLSGAAVSAALFHSLSPEADGEPTHRVTAPRAPVGSGALPLPPPAEPATSGEPQQQTAPTDSAKPPAASAPLRLASPPDISEDLALMTAARAALRDGNDSRALELLAHHERRFPRSAFAEERAGLRAVARCRTGGGRELGASFVARFPQSPLTGLVSSTCRLDEPSDTKETER